ncbi:MAG: peptidase glycoprotease [Akkermansiaceae bacterium]|nr:peptidase glycoprotease [Akkermansiaceae bacterium]
MIGLVAQPAILCLETSTPRASIAILRGGDVLFEASFTSDRSHNATLFEPLQEALQVLGEGERLGVVVVGTGPGSYSGTRVGIAAAQGVAMVHGCPAAGISSLAAVPLESAPAEALAIGDARRGSAWWTTVEVGKPVAEPKLLPVSELLEILTSGRPVFSLESVSKLGLPPEWLENVMVGVPDAIGVGRAWQALSPDVRREFESLPVQPVYLRPPHITEAKGGHPLVTGRKP